jgi:tRNA-dihydrouridine synthase 4
MMGNVDHQHNGFNEYSTPLDLLNSGQLVKICAPMVRYSRLAFRSLVRKYNCDIAYSPMIIAESFVQSVKARDSDFTTNSYDQPLIVQFAANNANIFADAAQIVAPYADGVDINCGCPQRWAMQEGYGACLLRKPQLLSEMISAARSHIKQPSDKFTISIKIRLHDNIVDTVDLCRKAVHAGVSFITVHGRTPVQRCQPIDTGAIRLLADTVGVPVVANGDIRSLGDALSIQQQTGVNGVMSARGLLANPAMFAGYDSTPLQCVADWVDISTQLGIPFQAFHQHLMFMLDGVFSKAERRIFNSLSSTSAILDYLTHVCGIPHLQSTTLAASN